MHPSDIVMAFFLATLMGASLGCGPGPGSVNSPRRGSASEDPRLGAAATEPRRPSRAVMGAICERVEDCAVERNVALARLYGGTAEDEARARSEAREAVLDGAVKRWCMVKLRGLSADQVDRMRGCLDRGGCEAFHRCVDLYPDPRAPIPRASAR